MRKSSRICILWHFGTVWSQTPKRDHSFSIVPMLLLLLFCQNKASCCIFAWPQGYRLYSRIKRQRGLFVQELNNDYIHNPLERDMVKQPFQGLQSLGTCIRDNIYRLYSNGWTLKTTEFFLMYCIFIVYVLSCIVKVFSNDIGRDHCKHGQCWPVLG